VRYLYDALDRLVSADATAEARPGVTDRFSSTFAYSDIHNLTRNAQVRQIVQGSGQGEFPPHSNHDLDYHYEGSAPHQATRIGELKITYDANGNTSIQCRAGLGICAGTASVDVTGLPASHDHWRRYDWTEENRLRQVVSGGGNTTRFLYDASGERVVKFGRGTPSVTIGQFFTVQSGHHATKHVFAGTERVASKLIPVPEEVAVWQQGGAAASGCFSSGCTFLAAGPKTVPLREETYYYPPDPLGSTSWMTDHEGKVHEHVEYFPYGEVWRDSKVDDDPGPQPRTPAYLFTSKEFDPETRLYYYGARYYDATRARWISPDPLLMTHAPTPRLASAFLYSNASPVRFIDPDGKVGYDADHRRWFLQPGDTLERVARQTGFTTAEIAAAGTNRNIKWSAVKGNESIAIPQTSRIQTFEAAAEQLGSTAWAYAGKKDEFGPNTNKCNKFCADVASQSGFRYPRHRILWGLIERPSPATAGELGDPGVQLPGLSVVPEAQKKIGDVVGFKKNFSDATGHSAIYAGDVDIIKGGRDVRKDNQAQPGQDATIGAGEFTVNYRTLYYLKYIDPHRYDNPVYRRIEQ
jgi:RHS repeat-associated protein